MYRWRSSGWYAWSIFLFLSDFINIMNPALLDLGTISPIEPTPEDSDPCCANLMFKNGVGWIQPRFKSLKNFERTSTLG